MCQAEKSSIATAAVKAHYRALRKALRCIERVSRRISEVVEKAEDMVVSSSYHEGIQLLPTEVLCTIFEFAVNGSHKARGEIAISLSHVNRKWRHAATELSRIWTDIKLLGNLDRIRTSLYRSKNALIDISMNPHASDNRSFDPREEMEKLHKSPKLRYPT